MVAKSVKGVFQTRKIGDLSNFKNLNGWRAKIVVWTLGFWTEQNDQWKPFGSANQTTPRTSTSIDLLFLLGRKPWWLLLKHHPPRLTLDWVRLVGTLLFLLFLLEALN